MKTINLRDYYSVYIEDTFVEVFDEIAAFFAEKKQKREKALVFLNETQRRRIALGRRKKLINNSGIPQHEVEIIARILLPDIIAFYESEEGQQAFAEWKLQQDAERQNGNMADKAA